MRPWTFALITFGAMLVPATLRAETVRFRYAPIDNCGRTRLIPIGPEGAAGELFRGLGMRAQPFPHVFRPTHHVTFRHPNGKNIIVPLSMPPETPRLEQRADRIVYHFDSYDIEVRFFEDGTVDVLYNSGIFRPLTGP